MKTVLILEDDAWLRESYQRVLKRAGYNVVVTSTAHEAIQCIDTMMPSVCIVDILLDGHSALGLLHELQTYNDTQRIPIIICSSLQHPLLDVRKLHNYGVVSVLEKQTITPETLLRTVNEVAI